MKEVLEGNWGFFGLRLGANVAAILGAMGLVLAVVGVYGVVSYATTQRTREIGIRTALGARRSDILRLVLIQALRLVMAGEARGVGGGLGIDTHDGAFAGGYQPQRSCHLPWRNSAAVGCGISGLWDSGASGHED